MMITLFIPCCPQPMGGCAGVLSLFGMSLPKKFGIFNLGDKKGGCEVVCLLWFRLVFFLLEVRFCIAFWLCIF